MSTTLQTPGYQHAIKLLHNASSVHGFVASVNDLDNYKRVWTRDGVVNGLAALLSGDEALIDTFRRTLITVFEHQHPLGFMPSNVTPEGHASYGGTAGRADNPSWAVIGLCHHYLSTDDDTLIHQYVDRVDKCFHVMDVWEYNGKHLLYVPQSGDWADEYLYHGYVLFDQLLRLWALRLAGQVYNRSDWTYKAARIKQVIEHNFWNHDDDTNLYASNLVHQKKGAPTQFWFMGFNPGRIYTQFDLQANSLALLLQLGTDAQCVSVMDYMMQLLDAYAHMLPSFHPPVEHDMWEMQELKNNYAYSFRNKPHEFHNGGLWSVWNGFATAAFVKHNRHAEASRLLNYIHEANAADQWNFNECLHGKHKSAIGIPHCAWSAGGAIIAAQALQNNLLRC